MVYHYTVNYKKQMNLMSNIFCKILLLKYIFSFGLVTQNPRKVTCKQCKQKLQEMYKSYL